jgi:hypothetical protein
MNPSDFPLQNACGCCNGIEARSPVLIQNRPGLSAVAYRIGDHADVLASMLARLSSQDYPALSQLRTRDKDDFSIALLDAYAGMADVLSFYQERTANESWLRTARERFSLQEMARLIGYRLNPGVAAETWLAFTVEEADGAPEKVRLDTGTRVQSVPGQDEKPQTFETVEKFTARPDWNSIAVQSSIPWQPQKGDRDLFLSGTNHNLQPGDVILIVGEHRRLNPGSERWDARMLDKVEVDSANDRTRVVWSRGLGHSAPSTDPAGSGIDVYVFRQKASLFGHNAPDPHVFPTSGTGINTLYNATTFIWNKFSIQNNQIDLDAAYDKIVAKSWLLLVSNEDFNNDALPGYVELYRAQKVSIQSRSDFSLSTKITRVKPDTTEHLDRYELRETRVYAQSELLPTLRRPLVYPVFGDTLPLAQLIVDLEPGKALAVSGKKARIGIDANNLLLHLDDGNVRALNVNDSLQLISAPAKRAGGAVSPLTPAEFGEILIREAPSSLRLRLMDRDGAMGTLDAETDQILLLSPEKEDSIVSEIIFIADNPMAVSNDPDHTTIDLASELTNVYDRSTVSIAANVARATHGETVHQILGNGDTRLSHQNFGLKHAPLTFVRADNESGAEATLDVRVNDIAWHEKPTLYGAGPGDHSYVVRVDEDDSASIRFGDGQNGARLPSGQENVRASYRKGIGIAGNLKTGQLSQLMTRPLGLKEVSNPMPSSGGVDAEAAEEARNNMPLGVRTLGRAVSLRDYEDFARAYTGIAKAQARVLDIHGIRTIFITVAGNNAAQPQSGGPELSRLLASLRQSSDPLVACDAAPYNKAYFKLALRFKRQPDHQSDIVLAAVEAVLRQAFSFDACDFGQIVSRSEVITVVQNVPGVVAVDVDYFYRGTTQTLEDRLGPAAATVDLNGDGVAAELLLLDPGPLDYLEEMP